MEDRAALEERCWKRAEAVSDAADVVAETFGLDENQRDEVVYLIVDWYGYDGDTPADAVAEWQEEVRLRAWNPMRELDLFAAALVRGVGGR